MKITLNVIPRPMFSEHTLFTKPDLHELRKTQTVTVRGDFVTKTRINTQMQITKGRDMHGINIAIDGYKTDRVEEFSYFSGRYSYPEYFKKSKKQNAECYKEYVKEVVKFVLNDYFSISLDELTINLILPKDFE